MVEVPKNGLIKGNDGKYRCFWYGGHEDCREYHDKEWGRKITDDFRLFEKIILEGFQSGLSWLTILRRREGFRKAFKDFDFNKVARMTSRDVERLLKDEGIIRHRGKIKSTINNAKRAIALKKEFGSIKNFVWQYIPDPKTRPKKMTWNALLKMGITPESIELSKELKKRGWSYVGPTTIYAFMQAVGVVNDHIEGCHFREQR